MKKPPTKVVGSNDEALNAFIAQVETANELLAEIKTHIADDMMGIGPDEVNWTHVSEAQYVVSLLEKIRDHYLNE